MSILDALFFKYFGPVFIKEDSDAESFVEKMKSLSSRASGKIKDKIDAINPKTQTSYLIIFAICGLIIPKDLIIA